MVPSANGGDPIRITVLGDSLTAGYGLPSGQDFPSRLEASLKSRGWSVAVANMGVSGDTSAGGLARLDWALADNPKLMILELGANDGLRGLPVASLEKNLEAIILAVKTRNIAVLLAGMRAPQNMGRDYASQFHAVYGRLAQKHNLPLYPFFLEGVTGSSSLNLADGIHPNAKGVEEIVRRISPLVEAELKRLGLRPRPKN